jgi:UDP-N-acetylglucosamine:LPS N-acetylglucosamine transferase
VLSDAAVAVEDPPRLALGAREDRRLWIVFSDLLANRIFFECGIVDGLREAFPGGLTAAFVVDEDHVRPWRERLRDVEVLERDELTPAYVSARERLGRRLDRALDGRVGFYPLAIRHSLRHGFHRGRWAPGHSYPFLDSSRVGPLPRWRALERLMTRWHLSSRRHVPSALSERMRESCAALLVTNPQSHAAMPFLTAARLLRIPAVGYIASWDHPVGKGIVSPYLTRYIVQNATMRDDLERYHGIDPSRVVVTGWPQTDVYHRQRPRAEYEELLRDLDLPVEGRVVLFAGNTPHNAPYEGNLVARLVDWWRERGSDRPSLLFRPHPYDNDVPGRYAAALAEPGVAVQTSTFDEFDSLVTVLQHVDCVVANAGTILLEAIVNDRPAVCVMFDEGAPPGRQWAGLNVTGEHYRELIESSAFHRASSFDQLVAAIERALHAPGELHEERERAARQVVGEVDGRATERVVDAVHAAVAGAVPGTA